MKPSVEIICTHCGAEAFLKREPVYDGFKKIGDELICSACGGRFTAEADVPFKTTASAPKIFTDADRSAKVEVFTEGENRRICRYCANYVVNPFMQFCSHRKTEVQSTDSCSRFSEAPETPAKPLF